jgi:hypothetical protein
MDNLNPFLSIFIFISSEYQYSNGKLISSNKSIIKLTYNK